MQVTACNQAGWGDQQTPVYLQVRSRENFQHCHALPLYGVSDLYYVDCFAKESFSWAEATCRAQRPGQRGRAQQGELSRSSLCISSALLHLPTGVLGWRCYLE